MSNVYVVRAVCTPVDDKMPGHLFADTMEAIHNLARFIIERDHVNTYRRLEAQRYFNVMILELSTNTMRDQVAKEAEAIFRRAVPGCMNLAFSIAEQPPSQHVPYARKSSSFDYAKHESTPLLPPVR